MISIKGIAKCFGKITKKKNDIDNIDFIDKELELEEIKYPSSVIILDSNIEANFKDLKAIVEDKDIKNIAKMAEEKLDVKSRYLFGKEENLFNM